MNKLKYFLIILTSLIFLFGTIILILSIYYKIFEIWMSLVIFYFGLPLIFLLFLKYYFKSSNVIEEKKGLENNYNYQDYDNRRNINNVLEDLESNT